MGLFDWLNDSGVFGSQGGDSGGGMPVLPPFMAAQGSAPTPTGLPNPIPQDAPAPAAAPPTPPDNGGPPSMPPVDPMGSATPQPDAPPPIAPQAAQDVPPPVPGADAPPPVTPPTPPPAPPQAAPPVPMPQPRPDAANQPPLPTGSIPAPPRIGAPTQIAPTAPPTPPQAPPAMPSSMTAPDKMGAGPLSRALGLDPDRARTIAGSLAAGLKAAGDSAGKSPMQALAGGAGAAIEGGQKSHDDIVKQQQAYLQNAINAKGKGDDATYKTNYLNYLTLTAQLKATADKDKSKNDSPTQLYLSGQRLAQNDPQVKGASEALKKAIAGRDPDEIAKAKQALTDVTGQAEAKMMANLGLTPKDAATIARQPGMSQANPISGNLTKDNISSLVKPGQWFVNPSDGKAYRMKGDPSSAPATSDVTPAATPPTPPLDPMNPAQGGLPAPKTNTEDDD